MNFRVISGGQTGADLAGLWVGKLLGLETGGTAPGEFMTLDGPKPELGRNFGLVEGPAGYRDRTRTNVNDADVTLIFSRNMASPGTVLTVNSAIKAHKPYFAIKDTRSPGESLKSFWCADNCPITAQAAAQFITNLCDVKKLTSELVTINVAGNATKNAQEAYEFAFMGLIHVFMMLRHDLMPWRVGEISISDWLVIARATKDQYELAGEVAEVLA